MYEDQIQTYDQEIREEYIIHDTPFFLPHHL